jgi:hypothetical protein
MFKRYPSWYGAALIAGTLLIGLPLGSAQADQITYPLSFPPDTFVPGVSGPYGSLTVNLINSTRARVTFNGGSSGGLDFYFIGNPSTFEVTAVNANIAIVDSIESSLAAGLEESVAAPWSPVPSVSLFSQVEPFGPFNEKEFSADQSTGLKFAMQSLAFTLGNFGTTPWGSAADVLINAPGSSFLASAFMIACEPGACNSDGGITAATFVFNGPGVVSAVPLPAALPLFASGLVGLGWISRRKRKAAAEA